MLHTVTNAKNALQMWELLLAAILPYAPFVHIAHAQKTRNDGTERITFMLMLCTQRYVSCVCVCMQISIRITRRYYYTRMLMFQVGENMQHIQTILYTHIVYMLQREKC